MGMMGKNAKGESMRFAAIDIGTVTCRLLVADVSAGELTELHRSCAITNLGQDVDANGYLLDSAMQRVDSQIARFMETIEGFSTPENPVKVVAMATSASRDASNSADFVAMLERRGVFLSVIPGEKEASLSFAGASSDFAGENILVADVGGGSTELIAGVGGSEPIAKHSFNIGCRRVTERFLKSDPPTADQLDCAIEWFEPQFRGFFEELGAQGFHPQRVVAVAGTATSMISIDKVMETYDSSRVHGARMSAERLSQISAELAALDNAQRCRVVGLQSGRAPVIVAGTIILGSILECTGLDSFTASEHDILHGMIMDAARQQACEE